MDLRLCAYALMFGCGCSEGILVGLLRIAIGAEKVGH